MEFIPVANTDLSASRIAQGAMTFSRISEDRVRAREGTLAACHAALESGINFFDHADIYGRGECERLFASIWDDGVRRDDVILQSKCGIRFEDDPFSGAPRRYDFSREYIIRSVEGSLGRLRTDYLDILLLHRPDALAEPEEIAAAFDELQTAGKVRHFGVSNHTTAQMQLLQQTLRQKIVTNQIRLNLLFSNAFDAGLVAGRIEKGYATRGEDVIEYCRMEGILVQAWSPLAKGVLSGRTPEEEDPRIAPTAVAVKEMAEERGVPCEAIVLAWILRHPAGIQPVIGTCNPERIRTCAAAVDVRLTREEWYRLYLAARGRQLP